MQIDSIFYIQNRKELSELLEDNSLTIIESNKEAYYNLDASYPFRQNTDLIYLTGINQPKTVLLILKNNGNTKSLIFVNKRTTEEEAWQGKLFTKKEIQKISGIDEIYHIEEIYTYIKKIENEFKIINYIENKKFNKFFSIKNREVLFWIKKNLSQKKFYNISYYLNQIRTIKKPIEITYIKKAIEITTNSFKETLKFIKPNMNEREIEGYFYYNIKKYGGDGFAYSPIIASGKNSCTLHYTQNNSICKKNDILLLDIGARFNNYNADITRVIPISEKFTTRQNEIYQHVYEILKSIKKIIKPQLSFVDYRALAIKIIEEHLLDLNLITKKDLGSKISQKYFIHGVSHHLGLDVHDRGLYDNIEKNMIITVEPGIYLPEEEIGVRLEDDILITEHGIETLTEKLPI